jgi:hypothetical protein
MSVIRVFGKIQQLRPDPDRRHRLGMLPTVSLEDQVDKIARRLSEEFSGTVPDPVVRSMVDDEYGTMKSATIKTFVPVFIDRNVRARLRAQPVPA